MGFGVSRSTPTALRPIDGLGWPIDAQGEYLINQVNLHIDAETALLFDGGCWGREGFRRNQGRGKQRP
jgi:hypothetical protein